MFDAGFFGIIKKYVNGVALGQGAVQGPPGSPGQDGKSAYQVAVENGYAGTETQWLASLTGKSPYDIAVQNGFAGTEAQWLKSLNGVDGETPQFRVNGRILQYRFATQSPSSWTNLYQFSESTGEGGGGSGDVTQLDVENAIQQHDEDQAAHSDIRTEITNKITAHNESDTAHPDIRNSYVQKESGRTLTDNNFTTAEKEKLAGLESPKFKGTFESAAALNAAYPQGEDGDSADVVILEGMGQIVYHRFIWDSVAGAWVDKGTTGSDSAEVIKQKYESNPDTNGFGDNYKDLLDGYVQSGKQLSSEDYTAAEKTKLAGLGNYDDSSLANRVVNLESDIVYKVNTEPGKQLSTNDYTNQEKAKLSSLENYDDADVRQALAQKANQADVYMKHQVYNKSEVDAKVSSVFKYKGTVEDMSELLLLSSQGMAEVGDVYRSLADGNNYAWNGGEWSPLGGDFDMSGYLTEELARQDFVERSVAEELLENKVNKRTGYDLSKNDFTDAEKEKLDGLYAYELPADVVRDASYVHTENNYSNAEKERLDGKLDKTDQAQDSEKLGGQLPGDFRRRVEFDRGSYTTLRQWILNQFQQGVLLGNVLLGTNANVFTDLPVAPTDANKIVVDWDCISSSSGTLRCKRQGVATLWEGFYTASAVTWKEIPAKEDVATANIAVQISGEITSGRWTRFDIDIDPSLEGRTIIMILSMQWFNEAFIIGITNGVTGQPAADFIFRMAGSQFNIYDVRISQYKYRLYIQNNVSGSGFLGVQLTGLPPAKFTVSAPIYSVNDPR